MVVIHLEVRKLFLQVAGIPEEDMVKVFTANGSDKSLNERMRAGRIEPSLHYLQLRQHWLIQQINRLLESLVLHECCISLFSCLDRGMAQQMLNISNGGTSTQ